VGGHGGGHDDKKKRNPRYSRKKRDPAKHIWKGRGKRKPRIGIRVTSTRQGGEELSATTEEIPARNLRGGFNQEEVHVSNAVDGVWGGRYDRMIRGRPPISPKGGRKSTRKTAAALDPQLGQKRTDPELRGSTVRRIGRNKEGVKFVEEKTSRGRDYKEKIGARS